MAVFFGLALIIWSLMHLYVFWRIASVPIVTRVVPGWGIGVVAFVLWGSYILSRIVERAGAGGLARVLEFVGANWIGILFLLLVCLLACDILTGFGFLLPRVAPSLTGWAIAAGLVLSGIALVQGFRAPIVENYEVRMAGLPAAQDGTVVVVASDMHLGSMVGERWLAERVRQIEAERPDLVVLAGDIVEGHGESGQSLVQVLKTLQAPLGVWAVNGNHETYGASGNSGRVLEEAGIHVLRDRWAEVRPGLIIAGVDDLTSQRRHGRRDGQSIDRALAGRPLQTATIFVSHTPWQAERAASAGAGLMLSGHTHNGQIWPFTYIVRLRYPMMNGRYDVNGMPVIVCRGTGTWGPRMRLWQRGELVKITLRSSS